MIHMITLINEISEGQVIDTAHTTINSFYRMLKILHLMDTVISNCTTLTLKWPLVLTSGYFKVSDVELLMTESAGDTW